MATEADAAPAAFDLDVADFLLKPFDNERLMRACLRLRERNRSEPDAWIVARSGRRRVRLRPREIEAVHMSGNYARLETRTGEYRLRTTLKSLEQRLTGHGFHRASRTALVNLAEVESVERIEHGDAIVWLRSGDAVAVSRTCRREMEGALAD